MTRQSPRLRRLRTDHNALSRLKSESTVLDFAARGNPPDHYLVRFRGRGLYRPDGSSRVAVTEDHQVSITLGASYPRLMPELQWKTPIFHPNISGSGVVCLGGYGTYWVPSLNLDELCEMLWDMVRYANYDVESPYNRDAANWAKVQTDFRFPLDTRSIRDRVASGQVASEQQPALPPTAHGGVPVPPPADDDQEEILFLDDVVEREIVDAEVVDGDDPDVLVIE